MSKFGVHLNGATGINSANVNGFYVPMGETYQDKPLFRKEEEPYNKWILHANGKWLVTPTEDKDSNKGSGWCESITALVGHPALVESWRIWNGQIWDEQAAIKCTPVAISFAQYTSKSPRPFHVLSKPSYPSETSNNFVDANELFAFTINLTVKHTHTDGKIYDIQFYKLVDDRGWIHNFNMKSPGDLHIKTMVKFILCTLQFRTSYIPLKLSFIETM